MGQLYNSETYSVGRGERFSDVCRPRRCFPPKLATSPYGWILASIRAAGVTASEYRDDRSSNASNVTILVGAVAFWRAEVGNRSLGGRLHRRDVRPALASHDPSCRVQQPSTREFYRRAAVQRPRVPRPCVETYRLSEFDRRLGSAHLCVRSLLLSAYGSPCRSAFQEQPMQIRNIPFGITNWANVTPDIHQGDKRSATWRTRQFGDIRVRLVEYSPGYRADHWCAKGPIVFCVKGEMTTELSDGRSFQLLEGQSYQVADDDDVSEAKCLNSLEQSEGEKGPLMSKGSFRQRLTCSRIAGLGRKSQVAPA